MTPRDKALREFKENGYYLKRKGTNHDIFYNPELKSTIPLKRHGFNDNDLKYIKKEIQQLRSGRG